MGRSAVDNHNGKCGGRGLEPQRCRRGQAGSDTEDVEAKAEESSQPELILLSHSDKQIP